MRKELARQKGTTKEKCSPVSEDVGSQRKLHKTETTNMSSPPVALSP